MQNKKVILSFMAVTLLSAPTAMASSILIDHSKMLVKPGHIITVSQSIETEAQDFIKGLAQKGIGFLENRDISTEKREAEFRKLLQNNFDMKTIGRFALGRYWKTSTKEQQDEYLRLFENMIVEVYSRRFGEYNGEELKIISARTQGKKDVLVQSSIVPNKGPEISVDWRVRQKKNGELKVVDVMVEGVSMSLTQRSDFASVIQRGGGNIDVLIAHLE